jgi:hypothetical protein
LPGDIRSQLRSTILKTLLPLMTDRRPWRKSSTCSAVVRIERCRCSNLDFGAKSRDTAFEDESFQVKTVEEFAFAASLEHTKVVLSHNGVHVFLGLSECVPAWSFLRLIIEKGLMSHRMPMLSTDQIHPLSLLITAFHRCNLFHCNCKLSFAAKL